MICFSPKSNMRLPLMTLEEVVQVVDAWVDESRRLGEKYAWVQIFENRGQVMGCSNPHPHGQVWATSFLPNEARSEDKSQREYSGSNAGRSLLLDYLQREMTEKRKERLVLENDEDCYGAD